MTLLLNGLLLGDGGGGGDITIDNVSALTATLAVDEVFTLPTSGETGAGWVKYDNIDIPENSKIDFDFASDGTIDYGSASAGFGVVFNTADKVNVYQDGANINIQNKTTASIDLTYWIEAA